MIGLGLSSAIVLIWASHGSGGQQGQDTSTHDEAHLGEGRSECPFLDSEHLES